MKDFVGICQSFELHHFVWYTRVRCFLQRLEGPPWFIAKVYKADLDITY